MWACRAIAGLLDGELRCAAFRDASHNGLQVENGGGPVERVALAVDASMETFEAAVAAGAQMVLVHHGLSWGESLARISGRNRRLVAYALAHDLAVYAAHLPLDAHPALGNNAQLARALGLREVEPFMAYHGQKIGLKGRLPEAMGRPAFEARAREILRPRRVERFDFGADRVEWIGICSGGAPEGVEQAAEEGLDLYLGGEGTLVAYTLAKDLRMNALFAGHYATERPGVFALGAWLAERTGLAVARLDFDLPY